MFQHGLMFCIKDFNDKIRGVQPHEEFNYQLFSPIEPLLFTV